MRRYTVIDQTKWLRKAHFAFFKDFEHPHFDVTATVEVTRSILHCRQTKESFFKLALYLIMKTANTIPEFRTRVLNGEVVDYEVVDAAPTYMPKSRPGLYANLLVDYDPDYRIFLMKYDTILAHEEKNPSMIGAADRMDVIYLSCIPWIAFTSLTNPVLDVKTDSVPRVSWGKYTTVDGALRMPVTVQLHHGLADAYHAGLFYERLQEAMNEPEKYLV